MFFIFPGNSRLSAALSLGGSLLLLLSGNYGLEMPLALRQTIHAAHATFARMWPVIETASFALLVVTVLLLSGDWWVGEALGRDMRRDVWSWIRRRFQFQDPEVFHHQMQAARMARLHALPLVPWRPATAMSSADLRARLRLLGTKTGLSAGHLDVIERSELVAAYEEAAESSCVICQDDYKEGDVLRELKCGTAVPHLFHVECIDRWLITCATKQRELSCPLCNTRV